MVTKEKRKTLPPQPQAPGRQSRLIREVEEAADKADSLRAKLRRGLAAFVDALLWGSVKPEQGCGRCGAPMLLAREEIIHDDLWLIEGSRFWECPRCNATRNQRFVCNSSEQM